jgi:hypothetical protein
MRQIQATKSLNQRRNPTTAPDNPARKTKKTVAIKRRDVVRKAPKHLTNYLVRKIKKPKKRTRVRRKMIKRRNPRKTARVKMIRKEEDPEKKKSLLASKMMRWTKKLKVRDKAAGEKGVADT